MTQSAKPGHEGAVGDAEDGGPCRTGLHPGPYRNTHYDQADPDQYRQHQQGRAFPERLVSQGERNDKCRNQFARHAKQERDAMQATRGGQLCGLGARVHVEHGSEGESNGGEQQENQPETGEGRPDVDQRDHERQACSRKRGEAEIHQPTLSAEGVLADHAGHKRDVGLDDMERRQRKQRQHGEPCGGAGGELRQVQTAATDVMAFSMLFPAAFGVALKLDVVNYS